MRDLILHHYDASPFAEKLRLVLGFKQLAWRSVDIPALLPKPDVVALTGGYRRTPVLQIGADIYCDTALMCELIDQLAPEPPLYAGGPLQRQLAQWADSTLFWTAIPYTTQRTGAMHLFPGATPEFFKALAEDRMAMTGGFRRMAPTDSMPQLQTYLGWLDAQLAPGQRFLLGDKPCIADFSVAQSIWFIRQVPPTAGVLAAFPHVVAWFERIAAIGHAPRTEITSDEAIAVAAAGGHVATQVEPGLGFEAGAAVTVTPTDYALDPVAGTLVGLSAREVVVERKDDRAGIVHVHFPRIGYQLKQPRTP